MKKTFLNVIQNLIFIVLFNTIFFLIGGADHPASVWISYGFIHFSYLMVLIAPVITRKNFSTAILGASLSVISTIYFWVELFVGTILILISSEAYKPTLIIQIIILCIYAAFSFPILIANKDTSDAIERQQYEVTYIKDTASRVKLLINKVSNHQTSKELEKVYDLLHSSPGRSSIAVKPIEDAIRNKITDLENAVSNNRTEAISYISNEIIALAEERNRRLKLAN